MGIALVVIGGLYGASSASGEVEELSAEVNELRRRQTAADVVAAEVARSGYEPIDPTPLQLAEVAAAARTLAAAAVAKAETEATASSRAAAAAESRCLQLVADLRSAEAKRGQVHSKTRCQRL